jgi:predicted lipid-binding transport protein (Tim44 family)
MSSSYADIIILAFVAGFILLRLRSILGQQTGFDGTPKPMAPDAKRKEDIIVQLTDKVRAVKQDVLTQKADVALPEGLSESSKQAVAAIKKADASFTLADFLRGAKGAFEMVFDAFLKNEKATLEMLLAPDIAKTFVAEAAARKQGERITETTLVAVESMTIKQVDFLAPKARITVNFISEQVTVVRDAAGKIIEGNASHVERVEDEWTFERDVNAKNPNWVVIDT